MVDKEYLRKRTEELIAAPMCYPALKLKAEAWLDSIGQEREGYTIEAFMQELAMDVRDIYDCIDLAESDEGKKLFGEEAAKKLAEAAHKAQDQGVRYCICPACTAGGEILDNRDIMTV